MNRHESSVMLAEWLAANQPQVFEALMRRASGEIKPQLSGLTDWLSSVGTSLGGAVKNVGSFLSSEDGIKTLASVGGLYLTTQAQKDALKVQLARAQAGVEPAPIYTVGANTNNPYPMIAYGGQSYPLTQSRANEWLPGMPAWAPWAFFGVVIFVGILLSRR